jgi:hypothetical protein
MGPMPNLESISSMRKEPEQYAYYCVHFIPSLVGDRNWTKLCRTRMGVKETFDKMVTVSDEAFGLLILENYWDRWVAEWEEKRQAAEDGRDASFKNLPRTKYSENNPDVKKFGGWRRGGRRYNDLYNLVKLSRSSEEECASLAEEMDKRYARTEATESELALRRRGKSNSEEDHVDILVDLDD